MSGPVKPEIPSLDDLSREYGIDVPTPRQSATPPKNGGNPLDDLAGEYGIDLGRAAGEGAAAKVEREYGRKPKTVTTVTDDSGKPLSTVATGRPLSGIEKTVQALALDPDGNRADIERILNTGPLTDRIAARLALTKAAPGYRFEGPAPSFASTATHVALNEAMSPFIGKVADEDDAQKIEEYARRGGEITPTKANILGASAAGGAVGGNVALGEAMGPLPAETGARAAAVRVGLPAAASDAMRAGAESAVGAAARANEVGRSATQKIATALSERAPVAKAAVSHAGVAAVQGAALGAGQAMAEGETDPRVIAKSAAESAAQMAVLGGSMGALGAEAQFRGGRDIMRQRLEAHPDVQSALATERMARTPGEPGPDMNGQEPVAVVPANQVQSTRVAPEPAAPAAPAAPAPVAPAPAPAAPADAMSDADRSLLEQIRDTHAAVKEGENRTLLEQIRATHAAAKAGEQAPAPETPAPAAEAPKTPIDVVAQAVKDTRDAQETLSALKTAAERRSLERTANTDVLTGLGNQRAFKQWLPKAEADPNTVVVRWDANGFKNYNDTFGHDAGDALLTQFGKIVRKHARGGAFRTGGDEFIAFVPADQALAVRDAVTNEIGVRDFDHQDGKIRVSMSGGIGKTSTEADAAAGQAKELAKQQQGIRPRGLGDVYEADMKDIDVEPDRFQFKGNTNERGVTNALEGVKYNKDLAGAVNVWPDPEDRNRLKVVNGHHRHDKAVAAGVAKLGVREIHAKTWQEARAIGALINIAEDKGTPIDVAKFIRDTGATVADMQQYGVNTKGKLARQGLALSQLHPTIFNDVAAGRFPVERAVIVGESGLAPEQQLALTQMLEKREAGGKHIANAALGEMIRFVKDAGTEDLTQDSLFGTEHLTHSLAPEKAELSAWVKDKLAKDRRVLTFIAKGDRAERIEAAGAGKVDTARAKDVATSASQMEEVYNRLSTMQGPVSQALTTAARELANGGDRNVIRKSLYEAVSTAVEESLRALHGAAGARVPGVPTTASGDAAPERRAGSEAVAGGEEPAPFVDPDQVGLLGEPRPGYKTTKYEPNAVASMDTDEIRDRLTDLETGAVPTSESEERELAHELDRRNGMEPKGVSTFYSRLGRAIDAAPFDKGTVEQWKAALSKNVAAGEREYANIDRFLNQNAGTVLTKEQVRQAFSLNRLDLHEQTLAAPDTAELQRAEAAAADAAGAWMKNAQQLGLSLIDAAKAREYLATGEGVDTVFSDWKIPHTPENVALARQVEDTAADARYLRFDLHQAEKSMYEGHAEPGGTNYREILIHLRDLRPGPEPLHFKSQHFDENGRNLLAHMRVKDRVTPDGQKVLFVEELQSDLHQRGREEGYRNDAARKLVALDTELTKLEQERHEAANRAAEYHAKADAIGKEMDGQSTLFWNVYDGQDKLIGRFLHDDRAQSLEAFRLASETPGGRKQLDVERTPQFEQARVKRAKLDEEYNDDPAGKALEIDRKVRDKINERRQLEKQRSSGIDDFPFKKTDEWVGLLVRRLIDEAVRGGYDSIAWTTGEQQADRYDLSKHIDTLEVTPDREEHEGREYRHNDTFSIAAFDDEGNRTIDEGGIEREKLPDYIGHALTKKVMEQGGDEKPVTLRGLDLRVGGEGMKSFYGTILPKVIKETLKKLGIKQDVEPVKVGFGLKSQHPKDEPQTRFQSQPGFRITPELRDKVQAEGQHVMERAQGVWERKLKAAKDQLDLFHYDGTAVRAKDLPPADTDVALRKAHIAVIRRAVRKIRESGLMRSGPRRHAIEAAAKRDLIDAHGMELRNPEQAATLMSAFRHPSFEILHAFIKDADGKIVAHLMRTSGVLHWAAIPWDWPNEIAAMAARRGGTSVVLGHNHPSGDPTPSLDDVAATRMIERELEAHSLPVDGHIVINHQEASWITPLPYDALAREQALESARGDGRLSHKARHLYVKTVPVKNPAKAPWTTSADTSIAPQIVSPRDVADYLKAVSDPEATTIAFLDSQNRVVAIRPYLPLALTQIHEWLPAHVTAHAAQGVVIMTPLTGARDLATRVASSGYTDEPHRYWGGNVFDVIGVAHDANGTPTTVKSYAEAGIVTAQQRRPVDIGQDPVRLEPGQGSAVDQIRRASETRGRGLHPPNETGGISEVHRIGEPDLFGNPDESEPTQGSLFSSQAGSAASRNLAQTERAAQSELEKLRLAGTGASPLERVRIAKRIAELEKLLNRQKGISADEMANRARAAGEPDLFGEPAAGTRKPFNHYVADMRAKVAAKRAPVKAAVGDGKRPTEFQLDPETVLVIGREPRDPSKWRVTQFSPDGPVGHMEYSHLDDAIAEVASRGEPKPVKGVVQQWAMTDRFTTYRHHQNLAQQPAPNRVGEGKRKERIASAAIRTTTGEIITGTSHLDAYEKAVERGLRKEATAMGAVDGFVTSTGRFVDREEAQQIAADADQLTDPGARKNTMLVHHDLLPVEQQPGHLGQVEPRLSGLHNLSAENLIAADKLGGFPAPSLAVVPENHPFDQYGDITMIAKDSAFDPAKVPVFEADAYTGRAPRPEYKPRPYSVIAKLVDPLKPIIEAVDDRGLDYTLADELEHGRPGEAESKLVRSVAGKVAFLKTKGIDVPLSDRETPVRHDIVKMPALRQFIRAHGVEINERPGSEYWTALTTATRQAVDEYMEQKVDEAGDEDIKPALRKQIQNSLTKQLFDEETGELHFAPGERIMRDSEKVDTRIPDAETIRERAEALVKPHQAEYEAWVHQQLEPFRKDPYVKVGRKKAPYNLENATEAAVRARTIAGAEKTMTFGPGNARAVTSTRFGDIEHARNAARSEIKTHEEVRARVDALEQETNAWRDHLLQFWPDRGFGGTWDGLDSMHKGLAKYLKKNPVPKAQIAMMRRALERVGFQGLSRDVLEESVQMAKHIRNMPVDYFEAKPQRAVGFDEFAGAVIPKSAPQAVRDILERRGVAVREYADKSDRTRVVQTFRRELHEGGHGVLREPPSGGYNAKQTAAASGGQPPQKPAHPMPEPAGFNERTAQFRPLEAIKKIQGLFRPETLGPEAEGTAATVRSEAAAKDRRFQQAQHALRHLQQHIDKQPRARQVELWDAYEKGKPTGDAYVDAANRVFARVTDERTQKLIALGRLSAERAIDNYIGRFWSEQSNGKKVASFLQTLQSKRPFEGTKSFLKGRALEHFVDGLDAGLVPPTYNYVESQLAKIAEMERLIEAHQVLMREEQAGRAKRVMLGQKPPIDAEGRPWEKIDKTANDPAFTVYGPKQGMVTLPANANIAPDDVNVLGSREIGYWYAPATSIPIWHNHLSKGLRGNPIYDALTAPGSAATQLLLGFSGFHFTVIATEAMFSDLALAIDHATGGQPLEAVKAAGRSIVSPVVGVALGRKLMREYKVPGTHPELAKVLTAMIQGGFRGQVASDLWHGDRAQKFKKALNDAIHGDSALRKAWGASRVPLTALYAGVEASTAPLMAKYVPLMKAAATYRAVAARLGELPKNLTPQAFHQQMWSIVSEMDDRFGHTVYDNYFINRIAKNLAQAMFLAPGWTFGTISLGVRGARDLAVIPKRIYDRATGKPGADHQPIVGQSAKYWIAAVVATMIINGLTTYWLTGEMPGTDEEGRGDGWKDFFAFRDGTFDVDGNANRHTIPGYIMHDMYGWSHHPVHTFLNKLSPFWAFGSRIATNRDYFGNMIVDPDADLGTQAKQAGTAAVKELGTPLSFQNFTEAQQRDETNPAEMARNFFGVNPAKREVVRSAAQNRINDIIARRGKTAMTPDEEESRQRLGQVLLKLRTRQDASNAIADAIAHGDLTMPKYNKLIKRAGVFPFVEKFKMLTLPQQIDVFSRATKWERGLLLETLQNKMNRAAAAAGKESP